MTVRTSTLKAVAGVVWLLVGGFLATRGFLMLFGERPEGDEATAIGLGLALLFGLAIGGLKGRFVLSRTARRNIRRIEALESPRPWNVFSVRFCVVILAMIGLGRLLRWGAANGWFGGFSVVGAIYVGIGAALMVNAAAYFVRPRPPLPTRTDAPPPDEAAPVGVLVVNLGTPDAPSTPAVRRYLREFLGDPRVIEVNRILWAFVLNVIILPFRSGKSAAAYAKVWGERGSPLLYHTQDAAAALASRLGASCRVVVGMRYGNPGLPAALDELEAAGCRSIVVVPLFPQFSNSTTGSVQAEVSRLVTARRSQPAFSFVPPCYDDPGYVEALATRVREARGDEPVDLTLFSYHGLPEVYVRRGDPYVDHCTRTSWALAEALGLERDQWEMVFQSRFGDEPWLQPYLDEYTVAVAPTKRRLQIVLPGFAADCLETLEEVGIALRRDFEEAGGERLIVTPALNAHPAWIEALESQVAAAARESLRGAAS